MRPLETLIIMALFVNLLGYFLPRTKRPRFLSYLPFLTAALIVVHVVTEKSRWQMVPAYGWCLLLVLLSLRQLRRGTLEAGPPPRLGMRVLGVVGKIVVFVVFLMTAALPWLFPIVHLPTPTGPHAVGTTTLHLVDPSRPETLTDDPNDTRELMARVWYPANPVLGSEPMAYWPNADIIGPIRIEDDFHKWGLTFLPKFFFNHFALMRSNSYPDAPISNAEFSYPVVLFSPGGLVTHERNFLHTEELASHGYIVISLSAPYESWAVVYPDGRVVRGTHLKVKEDQTEEEKEREKQGEALAERLQETEDIGERKAIMRELFALDPDGIMDKLLGARVADARFAADELERMNSGVIESPFHGKLDLERLGIFGMSLGGSVTGQVCLEDDRFSAGVNLDGTQFGTLIDNYLSQPFMFMNSGTSKDHNDFVYDRMQNITYSVTVEGSSHMDFTDFFYTSPILKMLSKEAIRDDRMRDVVNSYVVAFFDTYLKGQQVHALLDGPSEEFPDVVFKIVATRQEESIAE